MIQPEGQIFLVQTERFNNEKWENNARCFNKFSMFTFQYSMNKSYYELELEYSKLF